MLHEFLNILRDGEMQSLPEIARALNISTDMALQIANDLTRRGYLQEIGADCQAPRTACSDCPAIDGCHGLTRYWFLTEKGSH
jgi:DNA-binding Lrp family transcriptional regulator